MLKKAIVLAALIFAGLALIAAFVLYPAITIVTIYALGMVSTLASVLELVPNPIKKSPLDQFNFDVLRASHRGRFGRVGLALAVTVESAARILTWPIDLGRGVFFFAVLRRPFKNATESRFVEGIMPAWYDPPLLTFFVLAALILANPKSGNPWLQALEICFVASVYLNLARSIFIARSIEHVLSRPSNPRVAFVVMLLLNFGGAVLARILIARWFGLPSDSLLASGYAVLRLVDGRTIIQQENLGLAELAANPAQVLGALHAPVGLYLQALLGILFYFGFARTALGAFSAKREPRHYLALGGSWAALGQLDKAEAYFVQAPQDRDALLSLAAVRMRSGNYPGTTKAANRACNLSDVSFCPEEEAWIAILWSGSMLALEPKVLVAYLDHQAGTFADPDFPTLLVLLTLPILRIETSISAALRVLGMSRALDANPMFEMLQLDLACETNEVRQRLAGDFSPTLVMLLLRVNICISTLLDDPPGTQPDPAVLHLLAKDIGALQGRYADATSLWQHYFTMGAVERAQGLHGGRLPPANNTALTELLEQARANVAASELVGDRMSVLFSVADQRRLAAAT